MTPSYIICYAGKHPVHTTYNARGFIFSICHSSEATVFATEDAAAQAAARHGVQQYTIEPAPADAIAAHEARLNFRRPAVETCPKPETLVAVDSRQPALI